MLFNYSQMAGWNNSIGTTFKIDIQVVNTIDNSFVIPKQNHDPRSSMRARRKFSLVIFFMVISKFGLLILPSPAEP